MKTHGRKRKNITKKPRKKKDCETSQEVVNVLNNHTQNLDKIIAFLALQEKINASQSNEIENLKQLIFHLLQENQELKASMPHKPEVNQKPYINGWTQFINSEEENLYRQQ